MPTYMQRHWGGDPNAMGGKAARRGFVYDAYIPDPIADLDPALPGAVVDEIVRAAEALAKLQATRAYPHLEVLSRQLLRAESIGSSWIEGLSVSQRRVLHAIYGAGSAGETARAVAGNIDAMETALDRADADQPIDPECIRSIHHALLVGTRDAHIAGRFRDRQNWVGGDATSPRNAEFIPPPEDHVEPLMADLCAFLARTDLPPILQAAIAHAQFETIHPFADGNGRVGRALIHVVLRRRGAAPHYVPPISLVLATNAQRYIRGLTSYRAGNLDDWLVLFARSIISATGRSERLAFEIAELQDGWRAAAGNPRRDSAAEKLIQVLPGRPVLDGHAAQLITGSSDEATRKALNLLESVGVLTPIEPVKKHGRVWEAPSIMGLLDEFEWDLATPTRAEQERRAAPPLPPNP
ncbi:MAG: filamentation induced by cAMP protein Fic [Cyanobacteria bacterium RYN_339]|nr:filamentation induced by cAMP protein Fic [Cyanobacteria bacterium RYN_339]